jgi:hypothetical protein
MVWSRTGVACLPLLVSSHWTAPTLPSQFSQLSAVLHRSLKFCNAVINILYSMRARCLPLGKIKMGWGEDETTKNMMVIWMDPEYDSWCVLYFTY